MEEKGCTADNTVWRPFEFWHLQDTVRIGGDSPPRCNICDMQIRATNMFSRLNTSKFKEIATLHKRQEHNWDPERNAKLHSIDVFKYLDRVVANNNCNTPGI